MSSYNPEMAPVVINIPLGTVAADDAIVAGAYTYLHRKFIVDKVALIDGAGVAASDSNFVQVELKNGSDVIAELDSRAAHEGALVVDVAKELNISESLKTIAAESTLTVKYEETGTVTLTSAMLVLIGHWKETA